MRDGQPLGGDVREGKRLGRETRECTDDVGNQAVRSGGDRVARTCIAISDNQWQSVAPTCIARRTCNAISGNQWQSVAISGTHLHREEDADDVGDGREGLGERGEDHLHAGVAREQAERAEDAEGAERFEEGELWKRLGEQRAEGDEEQAEVEHLRACMRGRVGKDAVEGRVWKGGAWKGGRGRKGVEGRVWEGRLPKGAVREGCGRRLWGTG